MPYADPKMAKAKRKEQYWRNAEANREAARRWNRENPDAARATNARYRESHPELLVKKRIWSATRTSDDRHREVVLARERDPKRYWARAMANSIRYRAKRNGVVFTITVDDIVCPDVCPYFGIALIYTGTGRGKRGPHPQSPSLDRIVPALGYVPGNVEVISNRANVLKGDGTADEHARIAERLRDLRR